jgi:hypothetical protein
MACYRKDIPSWFSKEFILKGIKDGRRVREKAAEAFYALDLKELVPIIEEAYANEKMKKLKNQSVCIFL